jgi:F-type H+-transporting ATPase subunit delta
MADTVEGYANALFEISQAEGQLGRVSDELFRFSRTVDATPELRSALTDPGQDTDHKNRILGELLGNKAHPATVRLLSLLVDAGHARDLTAIVDRFIAIASARGEAAIAEVRVAAPISDEQRQRLVDALSSSRGRPVDVKVIVDPTVLGGVITTIGDEVIDGSVRRRLDQLRTNLTTAQ